MSGPGNTRRWHWTACWPCANVGESWAIPGEGMAEHDEDQEEQSEPPQRLFTLTEAERACRELEPYLIEAIGARKKLSALEQELLAVSTRILMMGGVLVPYAKLAEKRRGQQSLADAL